MKQDDDVIEVREPFESGQAAAAAPAMATTTSSLFRVDIAARSHPGNLARLNEDHYLVVRVERSLQTVLSNLPESILPRRFDETAHGMLVADGLGGMPAGNVASAAAISKLVELAVNTPDWIMRMSRRKATVVKQRMVERFRKVDEALRQNADDESGITGMSTITVALSLGPDLFLAHLGDSRAYLLRGDKFRQLTRDHTLAQAMIDAGIGEAENALVRGMRRVLTAALGMAQAQVEPEVQHLQLQDGDQLLLCTDGLIEAIDEGVIESIVRRAGSAAEACEGLIEAALNNNGADNVTVIVARYGFPQPA
ncbi:MAG TPA: PP2C family serine/threonine-protein phosphatase [Blastocatellia bacterium]|nr:PP2C family serine/threonine-protein phosphatase [Blastocatellia bacterium]